MRSTQIVKFNQLHVGDVLVDGNRLLEVVDKGPKLLSVVDLDVKDSETLYERVITHNPLTRLKRYLVG